MRSLLSLTLFAGLCCAPMARAQTPEIQSNVNAALESARRSLSDLAMKLAFKVLKTDYVEGAFFASDRPVLLAFTFR